MNTILVSQSDINEFTNLSQNLDSKWIRAYIFRIQTDRIKPLMGESFYNDFVAKYELNALSPNELDLLKILIPVIIYGTIGYYLHLVNFRVENEGVSINIGGQFEIVSAQRIAAIEKTYESMFQTDLRRLENYLNDNKALFPLYQPTDCENKASAGVAGIYFPKNKIKESF